MTLLVLYPRKKINARANISLIIVVIKNMISLGILIMVISRGLASPRSELEDLL